MLYTGYKNLMILWLHAVGDLQFHKPGIAELLSIGAFCLCKRFVDSPSINLGTRFLAHKTDNLCV